jgi:hypothetical protein
MRPYLRHASFQLCLALCLAATAKAQPPRLQAVLTPRATLTPIKPVPAPCEGDYCTLNTLQDAWKRDALKRDKPLPMNANSVILDQARFQKEVDRFGDPHAPAIFNYDILGSGICVGSNKKGGFGFHTC